MLESLFNKVAGLKVTVLIRGSCEFSQIFKKHLFLENTSGGCLLKGSMRELAL